MAVTTAKKSWVDHPPPLFQVERKKCDKKTHTQVTTTYFFLASRGRKPDSGIRSLNTWVPSHFTLVAQTIPESEWVLIRRFLSIFAVLIFCGKQRRSTLMVTEENLTEKDQKTRPKEREKQTACNYYSSLMATNERRGCDDSSERWMIHTRVSLFQVHATVSHCSLGPS